MTTDDMELVRQYAAHQSESAFATLVSRHTDLVYSVSLRRVRDPQLAEEVTQVVFIILARKAGSLTKKTILPGWLYRTTCFVSGSALKREYRRQRREQEAYMQSTLNEAGTDAAWKQMSPLLEEAMLRLGQTDRDSLVLRFFEGRSLNEVGMALGASEDTAKKRVNRAVEKLRGFFTKRGVVFPAAVLMTAISANSVQAAPAMLAKTATAVAFAKGATASGSTLTLIKGALKLMAWAKAKTAIVVGAGFLVVAGTAAIAVKEVEAPRTLTIRMQVDGSDTIKVSRNSLWIEHGAFQLPGNPIYVNGKPWLPIWNGNVSTRFTDLSPAFNPRDPQKIELAIMDGPGTVSIQQLPAPDGDQTISVLIDDIPLEGAHWYEFTLSW